MFWYMILIETDKKSCQRNSKQAISAWGERDEIQKQRRESTCWESAERLKENKKSKEERERSRDPPSV